ncbi:hypothetical protein WJX73_002700 [Symbiochloris irregularis]|uniref:Dynein light chain roadblock n=1 Tax=Symbiochloris irregularis TaxID=706552 RepID=A0AAW1PBB8_9CHLO
MADVEATLQRLSNHKGVLGCVVVDKQGKVLRTTCEAAITEQYANLIPDLAELARGTVRDLDPLNDLQFLRIRSKKTEIMVAPRPDFVLMAIQDPKTVET